MSKDLFMILLSFVVLFFLLLSLTFMLQKTHFLARLDYAIDRYFPVPPAKENK